MRCVLAPHFKIYGPTRHRRSAPTTPPSYLDGGTRPDYTVNAGEAFMIKPMDQSSTVEAEQSQMPVARPRKPADGAAFESFFEVEHTRLFRTMYLVAGNAQEAEEITQEAFLKVWERWDRVGAMEDATGYLFRTAMNQFRSQYRRATRAAKHLVAGPRQADQFAEAESRDEVARALRTLAPRQRAALVLTELLTYSSEEAASVLGVTAGTVRALAHQGREALRKTMEAPE
jgi:RNA polymerase sigma-70 factor, ECF subfamily